MDLKAKLQILSLLAKRNLLKTLLTWKNNSMLIITTEKYKKLKVYLKKLLKTRHVPTIKIQTSSNKRCDSTGKAFQDISNTKGTLLSSRTYIYRPNSSKNSISKPLISSGKIEHRDVKREVEIENYPSNPKCFSNYNTISRKKCTEEIAIVSTSSLPNNLHLKDICSYSSLEKSSPRY